MGYRNRSILETIGTKNIPILGLVLTICAAFWPILIGTETFWFFDVALFDYPNRALLKEAILSGDFSFLIWNPFISTGYPLYAEGQMGGVYPLNWLILSLFSPLAAYNLLTLIHLSLAGLGTYFYLRILGLKRLSAWLGGLSFMFSGHLIGAIPASQILSTAIWLPWIFLFLELYFLRRNIAYLSLATIVFAIQLTAGYPQSAALSTLAFSLYFIYRSVSIQGMKFNYILGAFLKLGLIGAISVSLAAIQLFPLAELVTLTTRVRLSYSEATQFSIPLPQLTTLVWPLAFLNLFQHQVWSEANLGRTAIYLGILPLILGGWGVGLNTKKHRLIIFFAILGSISLLIALGRHTPVYRLVYSLPLLGSFRVPALYAYLFDFSAAILAGYGLESIFEMNDRRGWHRLTTASGIICLSGVLGILSVVALIAYWSKSGFLLELIAAEPQILRNNLDTNLLFQSVVESTRLSNPTVFVPVAILVLASLLFLNAKYFSRQRFAMGVLLLTSFDLIFFASTIRTLVITSPTDVKTRSPFFDHLPPDIGQYRLAVTWGIWPSFDSHQPNRLMPDKIPILQSYTPLNTNRVVNFLGYLREHRHSESLAKLLGLANVGYVLDTNTVLIDDVPVTPDYPLAILGLRRQPAFEFPVPADVTLRRTKIILLVTGLPSDIEQSFGQLTLTRPDHTVRSYDLVASDHNFDYFRLKLLDETQLINPFTWDETKTHISGTLAMLSLPELNGNEWRSLKIEPTHPLTTIYVLASSVNIADQILYLPETPFMTRDFQVVSTKNWQRLYQNREAQPRLLLVDNILNVAAEEVLDTLASDSFDPRLQAVFEESMPNISNNPSSLQAQASLEEDLPMRVRIKVQTNKSAALILNDQYYPGWRAKIDGLETPIYHANYLFRGIIVPPGSHTIEFTYEPFWFKIGAVVSAVAWLLVIGLSIWGFRKRFQL